MKLKDKKLLICLSALFVLTLAASILRTAALLSDFSFRIGYFRDKSLITIASSLITLAVAASVLYGFFGRTKKNLVPDFHTPTTYIPASLLVLALVFSLCDCIRGTFFGSAVSQKFLALIIIFSISASVIYLFLNVFLGRRYSTLRSVFALAPIILFMALAAQLYFDTDTAINAPSKNTDQLAYIAAMLFFTSEARLSSGREKWQAYTALGFAASALSAYASVPAVLFYFIEGTEISSSISSSLLIFALFIFITARTATVAFLKSDEAGKLAAKISSASDDKAEDESAESAEPDENQISIDDILSEAGNEEEKEEISEAESELDK